MKILFQGPVLSPTWKGYIANMILNSLSDIDVSVLDIPDECQLEHSLGDMFEKQLDVSILPVTSSLNTLIDTFDIQILVCDWKQAWNFLTPKAINIVIGLDQDEFTKEMLANCYKKYYFNEIDYSVNFTDDFKIDESSHFSKLNVLDRPFRFIYPSTFTNLNENLVNEWIGSLDVIRNTKEGLVFYYPEPYCNPHLLASLLNSMELGDLDIDIVASPETISNLLKITFHENCVSKYFGYDSFRVHYNDHSVVLEDLLERIQDEDMCH